MTTQTLEARAREYAEKKMAVLTYPQNKDELRQIIASVWLCGAESADMQAQVIREYQDALQKFFGFGDSEKRLSPNDAGILLMQYKGLVDKPKPEGGAWPEFDRAAFNAWRWKNPDGSVRHVADEDIARWENSRLRSLLAVPGRSRDESDSWPVKPSGWIILEEHSEDGSWSGYATSYDPRGANAAAEEARPIWLIHPNPVAVPGREAGEGELQAFLEDRDDFEAFEALFDDEELYKVAHDQDGNPWPCEVIIRKCARGHFSPPAPAKDERVELATRLIKQAVASWGDYSPERGKAREVLDAMKDYLRAFGDGKAEGGRGL